jgi:hypothetical protein
MLACIRIDMTQQLESLFRSESESIRIDANFWAGQDSIGCPESPVVTDRLVIRKGFFSYGPSIRVDRLHFFAEKPAYRRLGLLILACVFSSTISKVRLGLNHPRSELRSIHIESEKAAHRSDFGYFEAPHHLLHDCGPTKNSYYPLARSSSQDRDLPEFLLTNEKEICETEEEWRRRDTLKGFGTHWGAVTLARLLIDMSIPETEQNEFILESYPGHKSIAPWSVEACFWLPGSRQWSEGGLSK